MSRNPAGNALVLACQRGARRRYAVPRLLEESGLLAALYTDSSAYSAAGRLASLVVAAGVRSAGLVALASRVPGGIPGKKIFSSDRALAPRLPGCSNDLSGVYRHWGLQGAQVIYSMYGEDAGFLEWAKEQGARIIVDVFVHPSTNRIFAEEESRYLDSPGSVAGKIAAEDRHTERTLKLADILLCPSEWVAEGVRSFNPEYADKLRIVPYGSSLESRDSINTHTRPGRILFAGREALRKGLHYLAEAAHLLRASGSDIEVRVAGVDPSSILWMEHREELNCLGRLPMDQMHREYEEADVFVLPSLSEGQAGVLLEAMACGCPVVATRESGVDFEDGCGMTVPAGDAAALADTLGRIVNDRALRNRLAEGALQQAGNFTMEQWKQRLIQVVEEVAKM